MGTQILARLVVWAFTWVILPGQSQPLPTQPPGTEATPTPQVTPAPVASPEPEATPSPATLAPPAESPQVQDGARFEDDPAETSLDAQAIADPLRAEIRAIRIELFYLVERLAYLEAQLSLRDPGLRGAELPPTPLPEPEPAPTVAEAPQTPTAPEATAPETAEVTPSESLPPSTTLIVGTQTISLPGDVLFDFNATELRPEARALLRRVVTSVQESMPSGQIQVAGHTDNVGSAAYNLGLSLERANVVKDYLRSILGDEADAYSWTAVGYGMSQPVESNTTDAGRQQNRRVDLIVRPASPATPLPPFEGP